ncbi:putative transcription factor [Podospora australis]|uniref:Transcription factor n=1 Tax=Podospora australis TaxID=1536484 RepID=A0AAN6WSZ1_9PEZI|nr:putative transcription factor [Podospora australis]
MDDDYASSDNGEDELMEEAEDVEVDNDAEDDNEDEDDELQDDQDEPEPDVEPEPEPGEAEPEQGGADQGGADGFVKTVDGDDDREPPRRTSTAPPTTPVVGSKWRAVIAPEFTSATYYDIVPTMAAPQATSINAIAVTPDLRYWMTGGSDCYIRKYNGPDTINGKTQLTVAQRHPFVDSVVKAGVLMSYWANEEPPVVNSRGVAEEAVLSPVYSLAVHREALWLLSGLESGGINLHSVRHDEGKRIHCLRENGHTNAVSVLQLAPDERSVLSGSWDKSCLDWDLNNGQVIRRFEGAGGTQISAIELRPASGAPIPAHASEVEIKTETFDSNNGNAPAANFFNNTAAGPGAAADTTGQQGGGNDGLGNPDSPEHESLFGSPGGSLFGDNDTIGGGGGFGDDDDEFSRGMDINLNDDSNHGIGDPTDFSMGDTDMSNGPAAQPVPSELPSAPRDTTAPGAPPENITNSSNTLDGDVLMTENPPPPPEDTTTVPPLNPDQPSSQDPPHTSSPSMVYNTGTLPADTTQVSPTTFLAAAIDGTIRIWDKRVPDPIARINNRRGVPPWCMGACWSLDGNQIYAGRRNGTVEEFSIHHATSAWQPERVLKLPSGSGAVSCVRPMANGRHLVCASHDILRLYDLREPTPDTKHSRVPFTIIPGPPRAGVISALYIDPTSRYMISAAGTRGWDGTSTEVLIGYEINPKA